MTLCPIAIAVGCRKCPVFKICPAKELIGDYRKEDDTPPNAATGTTKPRRKKSK